MEHSVNYILNNSVDKDVQSMLLPLNIMQQIMLCPKYRIKNNVIFSNSLLSYIISAVGTLVFISTFVYHVYMLCVFKDYLGITSYICFVSYFECIYYSFGFIINFMIGLIYTKKSIKFVLTFQRLHRILNDETNFRRCVMYNWVFFTLTLGSYLISYTYFCVQLACFEAMFNGYFLVFFDFNYICTIRVFNMLKDKVILWNDRVLCSQKSERAHNPSYSNQLFQAYIDIIECYEIHKVCVQQFILYYIIEVFMHSLVNIQVVIDLLIKGKVILNSESAASITSISIYGWISKVLMFQTILSQQCEKFYLAIQSVQDTCTIILKSTCIDDEKKLCKNVLRLHRASFSKIRVCGLFYLDAALQLNLMSILTNYIIVLLQFAYL